ncbi:MAG: tellurite resistance TerB family protein [Kofleriaceae bacterium]|nr:tellurite resistance TerB family protein [Kofleriaceae bacterium]MCL4227605.1 tellurite resistance TerB family protein [Myxococcales bacterium]
MSTYEKRAWWTRHGMTQRLASESFREAAVTCGYLVAAADGSVSETEYDALLDRLELLGGLDRDTIDQLLTDGGHTLDEAGFEPLIARVTELIGDPSEAEAALMLGLAVGLADNDFSEPEREIATQLATAGGVSAERVEAMLADLRD